MADKHSFETHDGYRAIVDIQDVSAIFETYPGWLSENETGLTFVFKSRETYMVPVRKEIAEQILNKFGETV